MPWGAEVSANKKGQIIGLTIAGKSIWQIENELAVPKSTIADIVKRFKETGSNENMPRSGHPPILTKRDKNHLAIELKRQRFISLTDISNQLPIKASRRVLQEAMNEHGLKLHAAAKKPQISPKNIENHKKWCHKVSEWLNERWKKIIWSDESSVKLGFSSHHTKVWCMKGEHYEPYCLAPNWWSGWISVMFWSCFWQNELGPLVTLPKGRIDSVKYCEILEEHLFPFYIAVKEFLGEEPIFMDDVAPRPKFPSFDTWTT
jgi:transposase